MKALAKIKALIVKVWQKEPARVLSLGAAVVVFLAAKEGVVVSTQSVIDAVLIALPVLGAGEAIRSQVTPAK
jgi:hypothetical protein